MDCWDLNLHYGQLHVHAPFPAACMRSATKTDPLHSLTSSTLPCLSWRPTNIPTEASLASGLACMINPATPHSSVTALRRLIHKLVHQTCVAPHIGCLPHPCKPTPPGNAPGRLRGPTCTCWTCPA